MKHHLLTLSLCLVVLCSTVACKNSNSTLGPLSERQLPFDNNAYISIPHPEGESVLRRKLLHLALASELKTNLEMNESEKMTKEDVFKFKEDTFKLSTVDRAEYQNFKDNSAEVIVSYNDHLVIYFVPTGISREKAFRQLAVSPESEAKFFWVETPDVNLIKEKTYYLVSATNNELKENDIHYHQSLTTIGADFNEKYFSFGSNQIVEVKVKADYFVKETAYAVLSGAKNRCKGSDWEAGLCGACQYKMEAPTGGLRKTSLESSELVDFDIIINGRSYPLVELKPLKDKEGNFIVTLDLKKILTTDTAVIEFRQNAQYPISKVVRGVEYSLSCSNTSESKTIDVTPSLKLEVEMKVKGRYLNF